MTGGVIKLRHNENRNKIKNKISGRRTAGRKFVGSSSVVGSVKKTTEEVTEIGRRRVAAEAVGSGSEVCGRVGRRIGRGPECPLTLPRYRKVTHLTCNSSHLTCCELLLNLPSAEVI